MKFFYILNYKKQLIDFGKINSERWNLLLNISNINNMVFNQILNLVSIDFDLNKITEVIDNILKKKDFNSNNYLQYANKFYQEIQLFVTKEYNGETYLLCKTESDNELLFLINIYDSIRKNENPYFLLLTNNHREFEEWRKDIEV